VVEKFITLQTEISIVAARGLDGQVVEYLPFENRHRNHILDLTTAPAAIDPKIAKAAADITRRSSRAAVRRRAVRRVLRQHRRRAAGERAGATAAQLRHLTFDAA
jgi:hypothetical protein